MAKRAAAKGLSALAKKLSDRYARRKPGKENAYNRASKRINLQYAADKLARNKAWNEGLKESHRPKGDLARWMHRSGNAKEGWYHMQEGMSLGNKKMIQQGRSATHRSMRSKVVDHGYTRKQLQDEITYAWGIPFSDKQFAIWSAQRTLKVQAGRKARKRRR